MMAANTEVQRQAQAEILRVVEARDKAVPGSQESAFGASEMNGESVLRLVDGEPIPLPARLPGFADRSRMPYLEAVFKEVMRFNPGLSMGEYKVSASTLPTPNPVPTYPRCSPVSISIPRLEKRSGTFRSIGWWSYYFFINHCNGEAN